MGAGIAFVCRDRPPVMGFEPARQDAAVLEKRKTVSRPAACRGRPVRCERTQGADMDRRSIWVGDRGSPLVASQLGPTTILVFPTAYSSSFH